MSLLSHTENTRSYDDAEPQTILVLGSALMQRPAYEAAHRRGWRAVAVDRDPDSSSRPRAAEFLQADIADPNEVALVAATYAQTNPVHGVFTCGTDFSYTVAVTAERLGLPGMPPEVALRASNKELMRECFQRTGIRSPRHRALPDFTDKTLAAVVADLGFPMVAKPVDNMGARGIRLVHDPDQLITAVSLAAQQSRSGRVILEQLIDGPEYSIDALVFDGRIVIVGVADRHICFPPYFVEMGHTIPTALAGTEYSTLIAGFRAAVRALGIDYGAAKGDVFLSGGEAVIGEIAARLSGGYMSGWTFPAAAEFEPVEAAMELALGLRPRNLPESLQDLQPRKTSAERAWISIPGKVKEISGLPAAGAGFSTSTVGREPMSDTAVRTVAAKLIACFPRAQAGSTVSFPTNNVEKCGNVIICAEHRELAIQQAEQYVRNICTRLEPGNPVTYDFLFGESGREYPWAFWPVHSANLQHLKHMPLYLTSTRASYFPHPRQQHGSVTAMNSEPILARYIAIPHPELETSLDYYGRNLSEVLDILHTSYRVEPCVTMPNGEAYSNAALGAVFWRALFKGGLQGALFIIDTINKGAPSDEELARLTGRLWHDNILG